MHNLFWRQNAPFLLLAALLSSPIFATKPLPQIYTPHISPLPGEVRLDWLYEDNTNYHIFWSACPEKMPDQCRTGSLAPLQSPAFMGPFYKNEFVTTEITAQRGKQKKSAVLKTVIVQDGLTLEQASPSTNSNHISKQVWHSFEPIILTFNQSIIRLSTGSIVIQPQDKNLHVAQGIGQTAFTIKASSSLLRINNNTLTIHPALFYRTGIHKIGTNLLFDTPYEIRLDRAIMGASDQAQMHGYVLHRFRTAGLQLFTTQTAVPLSSSIPIALDANEITHWDKSLAVHQVSQIHDAGFTGKDTIIALLDDGILNNHPSSQRRIWRLKDLPNQYLQPLGKNTTSNHASTMAAFILHYAPNAALIDLHVFAGPAHTMPILRTRLTQYNLATLSYAHLSRKLGADILNVSLISSEVQHYLADWYDAISDGLIISKSLGNQKHYPNAWDTATCLDPTNLLPYMVDLKTETGAIVTMQAAYFDGKQYRTERALADDAQYYTLTALETGKGATSQAAATFSGAMATLIEAKRFYNRTYTPRQLVEILFETAIDIGEPGVDPYFGHGLINLPAALKRISDGHGPTWRLYSDLPPRAKNPAFRCKPSF